MNILIKNACAILPEGCREDSDIYISDSVISGINSKPEGFTADKTIDASGKLLIPGFINAHTHIYMSCMRNSADDLTFMTWLFDNVIPMENKLSGSDARWGTLLGAMEMLLSGVTAISDMHMFPDHIASAMAECGMRAVLGRGLQGDKDSMEGGLLRIEQSEADIKKYAHVPTLSFMLTPHAPYTCGPEFLKLVAGKAAELGVGIHTHLSESQDEQNTIMQRYGMSPAEYFDSCGILTENTLCAHCVYLSEGDMELLSKRGVSVAHNPASNMKLGNGFAPVAAMQRHGINVALGTDGAASNNNQNMLREMQLAALIHKGTGLNATDVTAEQVFDMATINGARALGLESKCGEIALGKCADLVLFDMDYPGFFPVRNAKSALCYSSAGLTAETVLVNGQVLLEKGEFKTIDADRVRFEIRALEKRLK